MINPGDAGQYINVEAIRVSPVALSFDCCPSVTDLTERVLAVNLFGVLVELFHNNNATQQFYETVCLPDVKDQPCQFVADRLVRRSRCVQQYSYVYAVGRTLGSGQQFSIDRIRVPSGCKCRIVSGNSHD